MFAKRNITQQILFTPSTFPHAIRKMILDAGCVLCLLCGVVLVIQDQLLIGLDFGLETLKYEGL